MKRLGLIVALVLGILIAGAPPAQAVDTPKFCGTWNHAGLAATGCVYMHATTLQGIQAKVQFTLNGGSSTNCLGVEFDYVRLLRNGVVVEANNTNSGPTCVGQTFSTGYSQGFGQCYAFKSTSRYRFLHSVGGPGFRPDGHTSGWITRTTGPYTHCF